MFSWKNLWLCTVLVAGAAGPVFSQDAPAGSGWKVIQQVALPGDGKGDYLLCDADSRRLYVTHDKVVHVLDADSLKVLGTIEGLQGSHGVALAPGSGKGFITSGKDGTIVVFDLKTLKVLSRVPAQPDADAIVYDPATGRILSFNGDSGNSTVMDVASGKVVGTIDLGGKPEFPCADGAGTVFDNLEDKDLVLKIDAKALKIEARWPVTPGASPSSMAIDLVNHRLFIGCRSKTAVIMDSTDGRVVQTFPIGDHVDAAYFDPASQKVFFSCGDGTLTVLHEDSPDKYSLLGTASTEPGAKTMAYDPKTGRAFLSAPGPKQGGFHLLVVGK